MANVDLLVPLRDVWRRDLETHGMLAERKRSTPKAAYEDLLETMQVPLRPRARWTTRVAYDAV